MFEFFWVRAASMWIAAAYVLMGVLLLLFPGVSSTVFVWALAAGAAVYGASHLWRYVQARRAGQANGGDLFLSILPAVFALLRPQAILSVLPLVLGALLLVDGVGKLPLAIAAVRERFPSMIPLLLASLLPIVLGALIVANPPPRSPTRPRVRCLRRPGRCTRAPPPGRPASTGWTASARASGFWAA